MPLSRGQRLRRLRTQKGVEIKEAAPAIGISRGYLSLLERDLKGRNLDHARATLEKAAAYYKVLPEYLLAETHQEYIASFTRQIGINTPYTFGGRLSLVLDELQLRWGEENFGIQQAAEAIGATVDTVRNYLSDKSDVTDTVVRQLCAFSGAPIDWLLPTAPDDPAAQYQRVIRIAVENDLRPADLEAMIQVWLTAKGAKKPLG